MAENKKIRFEAEDGGVQQLMQRLTESAKELSSELMDVSLITEKGGKQTVDLLEEQIKSIERRIHADAESRKFVASRGMEARLGTAKTEEEKRGVKENYAEKLKQIKAESETDKMQISLLRELIDTIKDTAGKEISMDKKGLEEKLKLYETGRMGDVSISDQFKMEYQRSLLGRDEDTDGERRQGWQDVAKGVLAADAVKYVLGKLGSGIQTLATAKDEEQVVSQMWAGVPFIGAGMAAASERHIESQEQRGKLAGRLMGIAGVGMSPDTIEGKLEEEHLADIAKESYRKRRNLDRMLKKKLVEKGIDPSELTGGILPSWKETMPEFMGGYSQEQTDYIRLMREVREKGGYMPGTGRMGGFDFEGRAGIAEWSSMEKRRVREMFKAKESAYKEAWSYESLGYDQNEFLPVAGNLARASGYSENLESRTKDFIAIMKARGMSEGALSPLVQMMRYETGDRSFLQTVGGMEQAFTGAGIGRPRFEESLGIINQITQARMGRGIETSDMVRVAQLKSVFEQAGGSFAFGAQTISGIDVALSQPSGDFQEALNFKIYSQRMREMGRPATYLGFKKWQEQGIGAEGLLSGRAKWIKQVFGESEMGQIAYKELFGLKSYEQAGMMEGIDPEEFDVTGVISGKTPGYHGDAALYTTARERSQAEISNAFIASMEVGLVKVFQKVGAALAEKIMGMDMPFAEDIGISIMNWVDEQQE
jgi:hypothetical protein